MCVPEHAAPILGVTARPSCRIPQRPASLWVRTVKSSRTDSGIPSELLVLTRRRLLAACCRPTIEGEVRKRHDLLLKSLFVHRKALSCGMKAKVMARRSAESLSQ